MGRVAGAGKWVPPAMVCRDPLPTIHSPLPCTHLLLRVGATAVPPAEREPESFTAQTRCSQWPPQAPRQGLVPMEAQQHGQDESQFPQHGDTAWQGRAGWLQRCRAEWVQVWVPRGVWDARGFPKVPAHPICCGQGGAEAQPRASPTARILHPPTSAFGVDTGAAGGAGVGFAVMLFGFGAQPPRESQKEGRKRKKK